VNNSFQTENDQLKKVEQALAAASQEFGGLSALKLNFATRLHAEHRIFTDPKTASFNAARSVLPYGVPINYALFVGEAWPNDREVLSHLFKIEAGSKGIGLQMSREEFTTFVCRRIEDIRSGRAPSDSHAAIIELARLLCDVQGWTSEGLPHD
tara:strand:- start:187 stop:645 length:459 start_codon:yes stop_codon:yes gene_type:complete